MKIYLHVVSTWKIGRHFFWPHNNKGVSKCRVIGECQWLSVCQIFPYSWRVLTTHLIVSYDEVCNCMEDVLFPKLMWPSHCLEVQLLLLCLVAHLTSFLLFFLHFYDSSKVPQNCPMVNRYVHLFTPFLVEVVMLTNMQVTWWVSSLMKSLALSVKFNKMLIFPGAMLMSNILLFISCVITHLHMVHHLPFSMSYSSSFILNFSDLVWHYCEEINCQILLDGSFFKVDTTLVVIQAIILDIGKYLAQIGGLYWPLFHLVLQCYHVSQPHIQLLLWIAQHCLQPALPHSWISWFAGVSCFIFSSFLAIQLHLLPHSLICWKLVYSLVWLCWPALLMV